MLGQVYAPSRQQILQFLNAKHPRLIGNGSGEQLDFFERVGLPASKKNLRDMADFTSTLCGVHCCRNRNSAECANWAIAARSDATIEVRRIFMVGYPLYLLLRVSSSP